MLPGMAEPLMDDESLYSGQRGHLALPGDTTGESFQLSSLRVLGVQSDRAASPTLLNEIRTGEDPRLLLLLDDDRPRLPLDETSERANETADAPPRPGEMATETVTAEGPRHPRRPNLTPKTKM